MFTKCILSDAMNNTMNNTFHVWYNEQQSFMNRCLWWRWNTTIKQTFGLFSLHSMFCIFALIKTNTNEYSNCTNHLCWENMLVKLCLVDSTFVHWFKSAVLMVCNIKLIGFSNWVKSPWNSTLYNYTMPTHDMISATDLNKKQFSIWMW